MPRIRLYMDQSLRTSAGEVVDASGTRFALPFLRAYSFLRIGRRIYDCIVDTGSPLTVIPPVHWHQFAGAVEWLAPSAPPAGQSWLTRIRGRTGGASRCRVGRISITAFDLERPPQELRPVPVIAQFEDYPSGDDRILVGLHASVLQGRRLLVNPDLREGWLEDR